MVDAQFVNVIFGVKLRQARLKAGLTLSEFARRVEISPSYATEVEKGRKYPRVDKIMRMADVLDIPFNDLVSINLDPSLHNLESALSSSLISQFPFQEFGLEASDLVGLLTKAPAKASALLNAILEIGRQHDLKEEHFWLAALRSYQELHENYFPELEEAAAGFAASHDLWGGEPVGRSRLEALLTERFRYRLDEDALAGMPALRSYRSVFVDGERPRLLLNAALHDNQVAFLLAREIGYRVLGLTERAMTSSPDQVDSFRQVLNDFKASYFAGALMMPQAAAVKDIQAFLESPTWDPQRLLAMLGRYDVTPEMLLYRFSELVPRFFGLKLHFLRVQGRDNRYQLVKRLNMNRLLMPSGLALHEHYCRRWLVMRLLREMETISQQTLQPVQATSGNGAEAAAPEISRPSLRVGVQIDEFLQPRDRFLSIGFARPLVLTPSVNSSVVIGFQLDEAARERIRFLQDPAIPFATINETCERCPLSAEECAVRAAPPTVYEAKRQRVDRQAQLREVLAEFDAM